MVIKKKVCDECEASFDGDVNGYTWCPFCGNELTEVIVFEEAEDEQGDTDRKIN